MKTPEDFAFPEIQRCHELLVHFKCSFCCQWWTIGDFNSPSCPWNQDFIFCPKCGKPQKLYLE